MAEDTFDSRTKLKILRTMVADYKRFLVPSKIISDLNPYVLNEEQMSQILEKEKSSRPEAVEMLMEAILAQKEDGLSYFIDALKQENNRYDRFLNPLTGTPTEQSGNHPEVNRYFSFLIQCLEGDITRSFTGQEFQGLMRHLLSSGVIDDSDMEDLQQMSTRRRAVYLFRMMPQTTSDWPLKFFQALNSVKPELLAKCDPLEECPYMETDKEAAALGPDEEGNSEETSPKRMRYSSDDEPSQDVEDELLRSMGSLDFSDEDEKEDADTEKTAEPQSLSLRKYQHELAVKALQGVNTIICSPTGSGKTRVALHIVREHLNADAGLKKPKVVFMARTIPLVSQQFKIFQKYLPDFRCDIFHGETTNHDVLHLMLDDLDILVMTPRILTNHLTRKTIPSLTVFSLIIFDECHHTRKGEPYNLVMKNYLQLKKDSGPTNLPQIVGLTASIGLEKASTLEGAKQSIIGIMANLDVSNISMVKENVEELKRTVPTPNERLEELTPRANDDISKAICNNMTCVERLLNQQVPDLLVDQEFQSVKSLLGKRPAERNSQKYGQWAVKVCDQAKKVYIPPQPDSQVSKEMIQSRRLFSQNVQLLSEALIAYNEALDVHELSRPVDVLDHLKDRLGPRHAADSPNPSPVEKELLRVFEGLQRKLEGAANSRNPNLKKLSAVIEEHMEGQWDTSRVMIFVRTRATCQALCSWLKNDDDINPCLQSFNASPFTGTGVHQEHGGMTQNDQEEVIERFRDGDIKLLVCTTVGQEGIDIPDCNLVIRYNQVGNEVATVQTRGRSRRAEGMSMLLAMPEVIRKERLNKRRVEIMYQAIDMVNQMRAKEVSNKVLQTQRQTMNKDEMKRIASLRTKGSGAKQGRCFMLECGRCRKVCVPGSCIRTISSNHHVVFENDLVGKQEVSIKPRSKPKHVDNAQFTGEVICNKCPVMKQNLLGTVMKYQGAEFLTLKAESWVVLDEKHHVQKSGKWKWGDIKGVYDIPELTPQEFSIHLGLPQGTEGEEEMGAVGGSSE